MFFILGKLLFIKKIITIRDKFMVIHFGFFGCKQNYIRIIYSLNRTKNQLREFFREPSYLHRL